MVESNITRDHLDELEQKLAGGLQFANLLASMNQESIRGNAVLLNSLVELLISKGLLHLHELEERRKAIAESLSQNEEQMPRVHLIDASDKYAEDSELIVDCESRYPLCRGICCTLWFALSVQDLEERIVRWNYAYPYGIAQDQDGYCVHFERSSYQCTIYENRPLLCRTYDCRSDKRIWIDFESKIINPELGPRLEKLKV